MDVSFKSHVCFDLSVNRKVAEGEYFLFVLGILVPGLEEVIGLLNFQLVFQEAFHPENVIILPF